MADISWQVVAIIAIIAIVVIVIVILALFRDSIDAYISARSVRPTVKYKTTAEEHLLFNRPIKDPIYHTYEDLELWKMLAKRNITRGRVRSDENLIV
jgi:hypothetical protein